MLLTRTSLDSPAELSRTQARNLLRERGIDRALRVIAAVCLTVFAARIVLPQGVQMGYILALALAPLWLVVIRRFHFGWPVITTGVLALGAGIWLAGANSGDRIIDASIFTSSNVRMLGVVVGIGLLLWARTLLSPATIAFWFGVGLFLDIDPSSALFSSNPWKFGFYLPVAIGGLALAHASRRWWVEVLALLALTGISAVSDARSAFGLLLLAAFLLIAQLPILRAGHRGSSALVFLGLIAVSTVVWVVGQAAILGGYLGSATQARSLEQVRASGSLILGGRPELAATLALMRDHPWGYGAGVAPSQTDIDVAKAGMSSIGYDPNNNYVDVYMFGGHFELHSVFGDVWAQAGLFGLLFIVVLFVALLWSVSRRMADGTASGVMLFAAATALWLMLFGPWQSTAPYVVLAVGLVAVPRLAPRGDRAHADEGQRLYSTTSSTGPRQRLVSRKPASSSTEASASVEVEGVARSVTTQIRSNDPRSTRASASG